ncbi:ABC-2 type transport system ATP-binding protein [Alteribacillus persepolensis]|uniref:ABC-2 type transport system ATP-binding protein n=1 Tax=Alteribacillus persepolensis TaxID=568899 RepID=A0A1G8C257_9BACI|nr:ABC transporter ATP-binding protein [Alteribacillus persepolensis]SDH39552.1 ABC-2 type transport system ATP-binding protein [Alteribacillus persepolensis]
MIQIEKVTKTYENEKALHGISLSVGKGSIYGLLGTNGAGKTTLLKILAGIYRPDEGNVKVDNQPIYENVKLKEKVVFISDNLYFFPQATIEQMAAYYRSFYPSWNEERYQTMQKVFQINPKRKLQRLSKGMQRQAAFWLSLSAMPEVLILDEPIDGLDPVMRQKIKNLLFQDVADRELTVVISSHNLREIEDICDHVGIMHRGNIVVEKDLDDLKSDTHKIQAAFSSEEQEQRILEQLTVLHQEKRGSVLLVIAKGQKEAVEHIVHSSKPLVFDLLPLTLEEIFIYEMGGIGYEIENILL